MAGDIHAVSGNAKDLTLVLYKVENTGYAQSILLFFRIL